MLAASASAEQAYPPLSHPLTVEQVPDRPVYYVVGQPGIPGKDNEGHTSNAGFVVTSQGVVVFDALGTPSLGWDLLRQIRSITDQPIRYIVVSHYHADHIYGLQAFKDHSPGVIIAQERAGEYRENEETADERASQRLDQRREALFPWVDRNTRVVPPDITFRQRVVLNLGGKRFVLIYAGPAHSASDMMMMVEPEGVLFAGDIVQNSRIPFMNGDDVDTANWVRALADVEALDPKFIIPGHGRPSTAAKQAIAFTRDYIELCAGGDGQGGGELDRFRRRLCADRLVEIPEHPCFQQQQPGQCLSDFLGDGAVTIQGRKAKLHLEVVGSNPLSAEIPPHEAVAPAHPQW